MPRKSNEQRTYSCCQCNKQFGSLARFYRTYSGLYAGTGYLPICRNCLTELFEFYERKFEDKKKAMQRICMAFDLYYDDSVFYACCDGKDFLIGNYIKLLNMTQYKGKTFDTTLDKGFRFKNKAESPKLQKANPENSGEVPEEEKISQEDIELWGEGFEKADYNILNSHYKLLKSANPNCDSNQEIFITDLCFIKMQQMKAVREGQVDDYNKLTDSYRKSFKEAGLKTSKETNTSEDFSIGINAEIIEKYTPAEYYKNKNLYKDHDNIGEYISRFMLRPLKNLMYGTKDRDYEFQVKDDESNVGTDE